MKIKRFRVWFRHRNHPLKELCDVTEFVETTGRWKAVEWGKAVANERGWWFMSVELDEN